MPSLINRVPPGLLSLLGIKALGQNPSVLADILTPELDVTDLYFAAFSEQAGGTTGAITTAGTAPFSALTVPPGELWYLDRLAIVSTGALAASTTYRVAAAIYDNAGQRLEYVDQSESFVTGDRCVCRLSRPFILGPAMSPALFTLSTTGTAQTFRYDGRFARMVI